MLLTCVATLAEQPTSPRCTASSVSASPNNTKSERNDNGAYIREWSPRGKGGFGGGNDVDYCLVEGVCDREKPGLEHRVIVRGVGGRRVVGGGGTKGGGVEES